MLKRKALGVFIDFSSEPVPPSLANHPLSLDAVSPAQNSPRSTKPAVFWSSHQMTDHSS